MESFVRQITFFSTAAGRQDASGIAGIAAVSFTNNMRDGITGLLVAGGHRFLQVIEGDDALTGAALERIRRDRRHVGVTVLVDRTIEKRAFAKWSMAFCGEPEFGDFATLGDMVEDMRRHVADRDVRRQIDCFARLFVLNPLPTPASPWTLAAGYREASALHRSHK
jgi:hypothetical protein